MRVRLNKQGSVTYNLHLPDVVDVIDRCEARTGNVVVVQALEEKRVYDQLELVTGRMAHISRDDVIAGALGSRRALRGFVGRVPEKLAVGDTLHVLNLGGVIGECTSENKDFGHPLRVRVLGMAVRSGRILSIAANAVPERKSLGKSAPIVLVSGTCMSAGKTMACCEIVAKLTQRGYRVAAAKLSGVACLRDTLNMRDHGASETLSFLDCGYPSTAGLDDLAPLAKGILYHLNRQKPDVLVVEMGDGIIGGYGVTSVFHDSELMAATAAHVMCANDLVAAWGARMQMESHGQRIDVMCGPATDNDVGRAYVESDLGLAAANARVDPDRLADLVEACLDATPKGDRQPRPGKLPRPPRRR
ncbi:MAG: hypothetical protein HY816_18180 [Candidatus Wallbacteria bacterium]|nr:hypothetical protein [Candidatus Wallbacteria bacterium]